MGTDANRSEASRAGREICEHSDKSRVLLGGGVQEICRIKIKPRVCEREESDCRESNSISAIQPEQHAPTNRESEKRPAIDDGFSSLGSGFTTQTSRNWLSDVRCR